MIASITDPIVGFIFPGEIAVRLGDALAYQHKVSLPAVLVIVRPTTATVAEATSDTEPHPRPERSGP
jgi:hypothetical protein